MATTYKINFNFTSAQQLAILRALQTNGYQLLGYKGATGANQITEGLPTWFAMPFQNIFGNVEIDYTPSYQVYVCNQSSVTPGSIITMDATSGPIGLGMNLEFKSDGTFSIVPQTTSPNSIQLTNARAASTNALIVGLAALINGTYAPFCAFTLPPQGTVKMTPNENVCLFAEQSALVSGSVNPDVASPAASFSFSNDDVSFPLEFVSNTYAIVSSIGDPGVVAVPSGTAIGNIINQ